MERIEAAVAALPSDHERRRVSWRGTQARLPIVRIELDATVLNPRSHRIRAQLESDPALKEAVERDPDGLEAQEAIAKLLRETPGFDALKQNLHDDKQREPGIVTDTGRLVNANTRAVALRDLGETHIEVMVLPADATNAEIYDLELDLQVAQDYRQDYTFTNQLLFVDDLIAEQGRDEEMVALQLRWASRSSPSSIRKAVAQVQRYVRHLDLIRDIQSMSGGRLPLTFFDISEQALLEFDTRYETLRNKDPIAAKKLRDARILGLLVDLGYDRQRMVDGEWVDDYLSEAFQEQVLLKDLVGQLGSRQAAPDGEGARDDLEVFEDEAASDGVTSDTQAVVEQLMRRLAESAKDEVIRLPTVDGERDFDREEVSAAVQEAMRNAAEDAKNAARAGSALEMPIHLIEDAAKKLVKARGAYEAVAGRAEFDQRRMTHEIGKARRAIEALEQATPSTH